MIFQQQMKQSFLSINKLAKEPYSSVICYPRYTKTQIKSRINELRKLGILGVYFDGTTQIGTLKILGKGYVGVVILAKKNSKLVAIKLRRIDSQRTSMKDEAKLLSYVNSIGVGPKLIQASKNVLIMQYLRGQKIGDWISELKGVGSSKKLKVVVRKVLRDCYKLDQANFDHGELSSISKHVIISFPKITMIDFESSSLDRRVSNVTSATQAFYIGSGISKKISKICKTPTKKLIIKALRAYKKDPTRKTFEELLKILKL